MKYRLQSQNKLSTKDNGVTIVLRIYSMKLKAKLGAGRSVYLVPKYQLQTIEYPCIFPI